MRFSNLFFAIALTSCMLAPVHALSTDKEKPINIEADQVDIDERNGLSTYSGKVTLVQGSLQISADSVVVHTVERRLTKIVANGSPARFRQRPDNATEDIRAQAKHVEYRAQDGVVLLTNGAELRQGANSFAGPRIEYDTLSSVVRASGATPGTGRVQVVIQPSTLESTPKTP